MSATCHARLTRVIRETNFLARETLTEGCLSVEGSVALRKKFQNLARLVISQFDMLRSEITDWRTRVSCGEVDFDQNQEQSFKELLRALIELADFLTEKVDAARANAGFFLVKPLNANLVRARREAAETLLRVWVSPEWETTDERVVKWDKEQTSYLRDKLAMSE